ncbi:Fph type histidine kinase [Pisolithus orientalis]|uniref:Fph type histidine kinase n=1 Tax=Pisolithus orientalis TaxID=936130 RepID=UPI0022259154|nr:Fph type histidine kinase [Pisolithus orientalis]KAI6025596.1 Fph type histidine kinase [Pisolithus orientalis]
MIWANYTRAVIIRQAVSLNVLAVSTIDPARRQLGVRPLKRRPGSSEASATVRNVSHVDLSSTYHAGSSSNDSDTDNSSDDTDRELPLVRGRRRSFKSSRQDVMENVRRKRRQQSPPLRASSPIPADYTGEQLQNGPSPHRISFTRSRSPHMRASNSSQGVNTQPGGGAAPFLRHKVHATFYHLFPAAITVQFAVPFLATRLTFSANTKALTESFVLLGSLFLAMYTVSKGSASVSPKKDDGRPLSPRTEPREGKRNSGISIPLMKLHPGFVWMSVPKNFRPCPDDGASTGLLLPPLIAVSLLLSAIRKAASPESGLLPRGWLIEAPRVLSKGQSSLSVLDALILSRRSLVDYAALCSFILVVQILASSWYEARYRRHRSVPEGERGSVPRSEMRRTWLYSAFGLVFVLILLAVRFFLTQHHIAIWQNISYPEIIIGSVFYQFTLYVALRNGSWGFHIGRVGLGCLWGAGSRNGVARSHQDQRGSLLTGFLLSPLLFLSRHIAQRPVRRLRFPQEKPKHRRALAAGFYFGTVVIVAGLIGSWTWWNLGRRDPWLWAIFWILEGKKKWTRPLLLAYWALVGSISVAGWNRQLSRSRKKYWPRNTSVHLGENVTQAVPVGATSSQKGAEGVPLGGPSGALGLAFPQLPNGTQVATDLLDAADKHVPTLGVNARRKFFHGLAVAMFLPAFALFIFAEYVRYFAVYPFGAAVHLFMNEFLDQKDSGTAILSHFYLLTGCAGSVWLEGPSQLDQYTGILALGVGDAMASIVGKRIGRYRWFAGSPKTVEGSMAFVFSLVMCAWCLRLFGLVEDFSMLRYAAVVTLVSVLEGLTDQNDNLTLPLYMWSMLVVVDGYWRHDASSLVPLQVGISGTPGPHEPAGASRARNDVEGGRASLAPFVTLTHRAPPQDPTFQMPVLRLPQSRERARIPSRPATASIVEGTPSFVLPDPSASATSSSGMQQTSSKPPGCTRFVDTETSESGGHSNDSNDSTSNCESSTSALPRGSDFRSVDSYNSDYDWVSFMSAYASGQWNPHKTPNPPRAAVEAPLRNEYSSTSSPSVLKAAAPVVAQSPSDSLISGYTIVSSPVADSARVEDSHSISHEISQANPASTPDKFVSKLAPPAASLVGRRFRKSLNDIRHSTGGQLMQLSLDGAQNFSPDATTAAATMRVAAARVNISPLALPSPEHELTDPMRGVHAAIPGSHPPACSTPMSQSTPGGGRKTRLGSFWEGTQDVGEDVERLSTIHGSNSNSPSRSEADEATPETHHRGPSGEVPSQWQDYVTLRRDSEPSDLNVTTVPALPRRRSLEIDYFPEAVLCLTQYLAIALGRAAKEEQMFAELGYLAPPNPPDELERRRALYKFNIWNTAPDINFDRIAHLVKLVFNTKIVLISLLDGTEQWYAVGAMPPRYVILCPCCATTVNHYHFRWCDEPTIVLDTHTDWRFAKNLTSRKPLVIGPPYARFYAGAPLRTQDGYNIGSLSLMDDSPRSDFTPRQRHTLKEFAAIVMREMELWRDKIQLRIRDKIQTSMEHFSRECLEIDQGESRKPDIFTSPSMDKVYDRAAKLVKRTLDVEEVLVMDVSHCEVLETLNSEATVSVVMHHGNSQTRASSRTLTADEQSKLNAFFKQYPDGKISEGILPVCFRPFIPTHIQYALTVPVFNIDKRPFALICAYNASDPSRRFLEGHELSYLRAIGVIILSAVLKRRMMLADQAKSLFISNISHELRTPLHGILAAAELLADTPLNHGQTSFLHTVHACGTSLVETVNHVLDFTKLSGNVKSGGVDNVITRSRVDLEQLVEEAIDGSWIGYCARASALRESEIGSVYAPTLDHRTSSVMSAPSSAQNVEIVVDIDRRRGARVDIEMRQGWHTTSFNELVWEQPEIHITSPPEDANNRTVKIELCGISQNFLKNHLFHPFSQENPLQTGTGLGLAIVHSIVRSPSVAGKVEVVSEEGVGTEIKVVFEAETLDELNNLQEPFVFDDPERPPVLSLIGFKRRGRGTQLLHDVVCKYLRSWWGFPLRHEGEELGDIVVVNEDPSPVVTALEKMETSRSFIILSSSRGSPRVIGVCNAYENNGGFCRIVHKPGGPFRLRAALKQLLRARHRRHQRIASHSSAVTTEEDTVSLHSSMLVDDFSGSERRRRGSMDVWSTNPRSPPAPPMSSPELSSSTAVDSERDSAFQSLDIDSNVVNDMNASVTCGINETIPQQSASPTTGGSTHQVKKVLVVEDNSVLRNLLIKWLTKKGFDYREATDGRQGVDVFKSEGPFDVVLLDLSMPVLDGVGATVEIRQIERSQTAQRSCVILALTGMSSLEDKRKAFEAGMDGYLVKPVAFKTLDDMFHNLHLS